MARRLSGSGQWMDFTAGNVAGVHAYGTAAVLFKRGLVDAGNWHCPLYSGRAGNDWGLSIDINTGAQLWFGVAGMHEAYPNYGVNNTTDWILAVCCVSSARKPEIHVYNFTTGTWSHETSHASWFGSAHSDVNQVMLGSFNGFDHFNGDIAAAGIYRNWFPSSAQVEAAGFHTNAQKWVDAAANATAGAAVWIPGQTPNTVAITDATGGGANQTNTGSSSGTVVPGPTGWSETLGSSGVARDLSAKIHVATSLKANDIRRARAMASKLPLANSTKANSMSRNRGLTAKLPTVTGTKATRLDRNRRLVATLPTATSLKGSVSATRPLGTKVPVSVGLKPTLSAQRGMAAKLPTATSAKASRIDRAVGYSSKLPVATSARAGVLNRERAFSTEIPLATSVSVSLGVLRSMATELPFSALMSGTLDTQAMSYVELAAEIPIVFSLVGSVARALVLGAEIPIVTSARAEGLQRLRSFQATVPASFATRGTLSRLTGLQSKLPLGLDLSGAVILSKGLAAEIPLTLTLEGALRVLGQGVPLPTVLTLSIEELVSLGLTLDQIVAIELATVNETAITLRVEP